VPNLTLKSEFKVRVKDILQWMTKKASKISDHIRISTEDGKVVFYAEGDTDKSSLELPVDSPLVKYLLGEKTSTLFSLEYITGMFRAIDGATDYATFYNATNYPLKVEYEYSDGNAKGIFLLAPRLENG
jgi:DNA polymerase III sliding clamp (beta) subunit (PCNA family)